MIALHRPTPRLDPLFALSADEWRASAARDSLTSFTRRLFPGYETAAHHQLICEFLEMAETGDVSRLLVILPPRHGKSELASVHFPAWFLGRNPDQRIIGCSHTAHLAYHFSTRVRGLFAHPKWPFGGVSVARDEGAKSIWSIQGRRGGYVAAGVGGAITGFGANVLLIDDAVKSSAEADSQAFRDGAWDWYTGTALTRVEPNGAVVVIGTRWHDEDLIGRILNGPDASRWTVVHVPALSESESVYANVTLPPDLAERLSLAEGDELPLADACSRFRAR